jgi:hypothetical protein
MARVVVEACAAAGGRPFLLHSVYIYCDCAAFVSIPRRFGPYCTVAAAEQELRKRRALTVYGAAPATIDIRALRAANQIMAAHTQQATAVATQTAGS